MVSQLLHGYFAIKRLADPVCVWSIDKSNKSIAAYLISLDAWTSVVDGRIWIWRDYDGWPYFWRQDNNVYYY